MSLIYFANVIFNAYKVLLYWLKNINYKQR
jgi:hypothetical protein